MAPCSPVWHQFTMFMGDDPVWFRLASRMSDENGTYIYRMGPEPADNACRTVWCYGDKGEPWICDACGTVVSVERVGQRSAPIDTVEDEADEADEAAEDAEEDDEAAYDPDLDEDGVPRGCDGVEALITCGWEARAAVVWTTGWRIGRRATCWVGPSYPSRRTLPLTAANAWTTASARTSSKEPRRTRGDASDAG